MLLERDEHALRTDLTEVDVQLIGRDGQPRPWPAGRRLLAGPGPGRPADRSVAGATTTVTGRTDPGSTVDVTAINLDADGSSTSATTTAAGDGTFSIARMTPGQAREVLEIWLM